MFFKSDENAQAICWASSTLIIIGQIWRKRCPNDVDMREPHVSFCPSRRHSLTKNSQVFVFSWKGFFSDIWQPIPWNISFLLSGWHWRQCLDRRVSFKGDFWVPLERTLYIRKKPTFASHTNRPSRQSRYKPANLKMPSRHQRVFCALSPSGITYSSYSPPSISP